MSGRSIFRYIKPLIIIFTTILSCLPYAMRAFLFDVAASIPSKVGIFIRYSLLKTLCYYIGDNVYVGRFVVIKNFKNLKIGNNVSIHEFCYIDAIGNVDVGSDVSIAHGSSIISFEHDYSNNSIPIKYNEIKLGEVIIESDVWIGAAVKILSNSHIMSRCIVGAGSVVKGKLLPNNLYVGIPAKRKKVI